jgi:hypothetical protein
MADDTVWSSPALYDVNHDGRDEIYVGSPSTGGGPQPHMGGTMYALSDVHGTIYTMWRHNIAETIDGSPAIADIDGDGRPEVIATTGWAFSNAESQYIYAWHLDDGSSVPGWPVNTGATTPASVAIGDVNGDGRPDVVVGNWDGHVRAYANHGQLLWDSYPFSGPGAQPSRIEAGAIIADINGDGHQDVVVPTDTGVYVLDGRSGARIDGPLGNLPSLHFAFQSTPAVEDTPTGRILVMTGMVGGWPKAESDPSAYGEVFIYSIPQSPAVSAWPMFHHDARRTGVASSMPLPKWGSIAGEPAAIYARSGQPLSATAGGGGTVSSVSSTAGTTPSAPAPFQLRISSYHPAS